MCVCAVQCTVYSVRGVGSSGLIVYKTSSHSLAHSFYPSPHQHTGGKITRKTNTGIKFNLFLIEGGLLQ